MSAAIFISCVAGDIEKKTAAEEAGLDEQGLIDKVNKINKIQVTHNISAFNVKPSPEPFQTPNGILSPFKRNIVPFNLLISVDNPLGEDYTHKWYRNGVNVFTESNQVSAFFVDPNNESLWPLGVNTIVSSIIDSKDGRLVESVTWSFILSDYNDPTFTFVCSPSSFGSCAPLPQKMTTITNSDRPTILANISNPDNVDYYIKWFFNGVEKTGPSYPSRPAVNYLIDPSDNINFPKGKHTLYLEVRRTPTGPIFLQKSWDIEITYPPPTRLSGAAAITTPTPSSIADPAVAIINLTQDSTNDRVFTDSTLYHATSGNSLDENANESSRFGFTKAPTLSPDTTRGEPIHDFCVYVEDGTGLSAAEGIYIVFFDENGNTITADGSVNRLTFKGGPNPDPVCLSGYGALSGNGNSGYSKSLNPIDSLVPATNKEIWARVIDGLSGQIVGEVHWDNITIMPANTSPIIARDESGIYVDNNQAGIFQGGGTDAEFALSIVDKDSSETPGLNLTDYAINFSICTPDKDCSISGNFSPIDGANPWWLLADVPSPDCTHTAVQAISGKNICKLRFPSYHDLDSNGSTTPAPAGLYMIKATITDTQTNGVDGPPRTSNEVMWTINVGETNTAPTLDPIPPNLSAGQTQAGMDVNSQSYIYNIIDDTVAVAEATEGDTVVINLFIKDPERDSFRVEVSYRGYTNGVQNSTFTAVPELTQNNVPHPGTRVVYNQSWQIPQEVIQGSPGDNVAENVTIRVTITDLPGIGVNSLTLTQDFNMRVSNNNPAPSISSIGLDPVETTDHRVFEGRLFTLYPGDIIDSSPSGSDGTNITFKWQTYTQTTTNDCSALSNSDWIDVEGAVGSFSNAITSEQPTNLRWTPPSSLFGPNTVNPFDGSNLFDPANNKLCFRVCVGDDGIGNNVDDCTINRVWGGSQGYGIVRFMNRVENEIPNMAATPGASHDLWVDDSTISDLSTQDMDVWSVHSEGTNLYIQKLNVDDKGIITEQFKTPAIPSDAVDTACTAPVTPSASEVPIDVSITGNDSHIFVGYRIVEVDTIPTGAPLMRIIRLTKANIVTDLTCLKLDIVASKMGRISASEDAWYLPFLETVNDNKVAVAFGRESDDTLLATQASIGVDGNYVRLSTNLKAIRVRNVIDEYNTIKRLNLAIQFENGKIGLYGHEIRTGTDLNDWDTDGINDNDPRPLQGGNDVIPDSDNTLLDPIDQYEIGIATPTLRLSKELSTLTLNYTGINSVVTELKNIVISDIEGADYDAGDWQVSSMVGCKNNFSTQTLAAVGAGDFGAQTDTACALVLTYVGPRDLNGISKITADFKAGVEATRMDNVFLAFSDGSNETIVISQAYQDAGTVVDVTDTEFWGEAYNPYLYVVGISPSSGSLGELMMTRRITEESNYLHDDLSGISAGGLVSLYAQNSSNDSDLKDVKALSIAASDNFKSAIIGVVNDSNEIKVIHVGCENTSDTECIDADGDDRISRSLNSTGIPITNITNDSFRMSTFLPSIVHGTDGSINNQSKMDTVWIQYVDLSNKVYSISAGVEAIDYDFPKSPSIPNSAVGYPILCRSGATNGCILGD